TVAVPAALQIRDALTTRDGESGRNRNAEIRHFREIGALAAEHRFHVARTFRGAVAEEEDRLWHQLSSRSRIEAFADRPEAEWDSLRKSRRGRIPRDLRAPSRAFHRARGIPAYPLPVIERFRLPSCSPRSAPRGLAYRFRNSMVRSQGLSSHACEL